MIKVKHWSFGFAWRFSIDNRGVGEGFVKAISGQEEEEFPLEKAKGVAIRMIENCPRLVGRTGEELKIMITHTLVIDKKNYYENKKKGGTIFRD